MERGAEESRKPRILIADDELLVVEVLRFMLAKFVDVDVDVVTSGTAAATRLEAEPTFDIVICDLGLPDLDGLALYERLRRRGSPLADRFLLVSGGAIEHTATLPASGRVPCLSKPFDLARLREILRPWLESSGSEPPASG